ncbi:MAG: Type III restriction-modification system methylation subunit (EC [uncultured Sulfurovum sp.]|uniref:site-specific DNA-methyltransferase (adenine-specific) n=1 Tax=uncultured Sulfurovum sp. TaxID=269237 RepID=A0A6S6SJN2_9BACT|nr:MAG: Type III restriction-modification system methylation subunit (EC [uncultured Sulfurovum sp.]
MKQKENVINEQSINDINYELLKNQFPHAISIDEDGKYIIDPKKLQMSLDPSKADIKEDGYGLNWVGKKEAYHTAFSKNYKVLKPLNDDNSKNWDTTENILIKGDNLDALKILRQNYFESIKMIYIDPPYNTKNDGFVYNDDFTSNTEETLEELGYDKEYIDYIENIQGAKTHSGWLSFMYPRLLIARDLLKDDGSIFLSIDDNEVAQLKLLCDEVFGNDNFVGELSIVNNIAGRSDKKNIATAHEYILIYQKSDNFLAKGLALTEEQLKDYKHLDKENNKLYREQGLRKRGSGAKREDRPNMYYPVYYDIKLNKVSLEKNEFDNPVIITPKLSNGTDGRWRWGKKTFLQKTFLLEVKKVERRNEFDIFEKVYLENDGDMKSVKMKSFLLDSDYTSDTATSEFHEIMELNTFNNPKSVQLIKDLITISTDKNDVVLDFFAGSGTTAHATMELNSQYTTNRKFITVQWAERTAEQSEARKLKYNTIFDITLERIKRAGDKIAKGDIGFRTFEIVEDLKQKIYQKSLEEMTQTDMKEIFELPSIDSIEDILYNLLVAESLPLSSKIQTLIEEKLYIVSNVVFVLGDMEIDTLIDEIKGKKELEYITVYSPNIKDDKFTLELESAVSSIGIKSDKLRFRG